MMIQSVYEKDTLLVVGSFILVTFLQRIMENRKLLERAEMALQRLSGDRRMVCVIALNLSVIKVLLFIIALSIVVYRLNPKEVWEFAKTSVEWRIIFNTIILMMFKNILTYTGAIGRLPDLFDGSAIPQFAAFGIITEYFQVSWGQLMKKTIPVIVVFVVILTGYYVLLNGFGI